MKSSIKISNGKKPESCGKPTPRPWMQYGPFIWSPIAFSNVAAVSEPRPEDSAIGYHKVERGSKDGKEAFANAALIVKAVNNFSQMEQMLKDCLCVMNASAVGLKTQEAVERLLKEIK